MAEGIWQLRTDPVCMGLWTQCFQEYWSHHGPEFADAPAPPLWGQVGLMVETAQALRTQACSCPVVSTRASPHTDPRAALCSRLLPHSPWAGLQGHQEPPSPVSLSLGPRPHPQCSWGPPGALPAAHQSWSCPRWPAAPGKGWCLVTVGGAHPPFLQDDFQVALGGGPQFLHVHSQGATLGVQEGDVAGRHGHGVPRPRHLGRDLELHSRKGTLAPQWALSPASTGPRRVSYVPRFLRKHDALGFQVHLGITSSVMTPEWGVLAYLEHPPSLPNPQRSPKSAPIQVWQLRGRLHPGRERETGASGNQVAGERQVPPTSGG